MRIEAVFFYVDCQSYATAMEMM